jgi:hypothetical protein
MIDKSSGSDVDNEEDDDNHNEFKEGKGAHVS